MFIMGFISAALCLCRDIYIGSQIKIWWLLVDQVSRVEELDEYLMESAWHNKMLLVTCQLAIFLLALALSIRLEYSKSISVISFLDNARMDSARLCLSGSSISRLNTVFCLICSLFWYVKIIRIVITESWPENYSASFRWLCIFMHHVFISWFYFPYFQVFWAPLLIKKKLFLSPFAYKLEWHYTTLNVKKLI